MARIVAAKEPGKFAVIGEDNLMLAEGTLQVEYVPGATRLGGVAFVLDQQPIDQTPGFASSLQEQVDREAAHSAGGV